MRMPPSMGRCRLKEDHEAIRALLAQIERGEAEPGGDRLPELRGLPERPEQEVRSHRPAVEFPGEPVELLPVPAALGGDEPSHERAGDGAGERPLREQLPEVGAVGGERHERRA